MTTSARRAAFQSLRAAGMTQRESSIATFPELPVNSALAHGAAIVEPVLVDSTAVSDGTISAASAKMKTIQQLVSGGVDAQSANSYATSIYENAPDLVGIVDYERMSKILGKTLDDMKVSPVDRAVTSGQFARDAEFMLTAIGAIFGGAQQGAFGVASGERVSKAWERVFPEADIRDPDGVVRQKSVLWESVKGLTIGAAGTIMSGVGAAIPALNIGAEAAKAEARRIATGLLESDYRDDLLTGSEVVEYWLHGDGLFGTKLPDQGTPERALYDQTVRDELAQAYAAVEESPMGKAAMGAISFNGALMDVFADPAVILSEVPKATVLAGRKLAPVASRARLTTAIADRSRRTADILVAVEDAKKWVDSTAEKLKASPTDNMLAQHEHAKKTLARMEGILDARRTAETAGETVLLRTNPQINPKHIRDVAKTYLGADPAQRTVMTKNFIQDRIKTLVGDVRDAERVLAEDEALLAEAKANPDNVYQYFDEDGELISELSAQQVVADLTEKMPHSREALKWRIAERDEWKETGTWFKERAKHPHSRTESFFNEAMSNLEPYQRDVIQPPMRDGSGVTQIMANTGDLGEIPELLGPGPMLGVLSAFDVFARKLHTGAPAAEVRAALHAFFDTFTENDAFVLGKRTQEHAEILAAREDIPLDEALDEIEGSWMRIATDYEVAAKHLNGKSAPAEFASRLARAMTQSGSEDLRNVITEIFDLTETIKPTDGSGPGPLKAMQGEGAAVDAAGTAGRGELPTKWDMLVDRTAADSQRAEYVPQTVDQARREVLANIKRGVAQGAPHEEILQWMDRYEQLSRMSPGDEVGELLTRSTRTPDEILREMLVTRRKGLASELPEPTVDIYGMDPTQLRQRVAYGPDQAESAEAAIRALTEGAEVDDIAFYGLGIDLLNTSYGGRLTGASGTETRNLGRVKKDRHGRVKKGKSGDPVVQPNPTLADDEKWLGNDMWRTKVERAEWQQSLAEKLGDYYTRGLYPGTWNVKPAMWLMNVREPMRVLQSMSPRLYTRIHDAMNAQHVEVTRMTEIFARDLQTLGVYREVNGSNVLDPEASARFYDVLNLRPDTEEYVSAIAMLDPHERLAVQHIRSELDFMRNKLGIQNTDLHIEGYMPHVFDPRWHDHGARPMEIRGMGATVDVFDPYLIERTGSKGFERDLALALDAYSRAASRKLHLEPLFMDMQAAAQAHLKANPGDKWFATYIADMINNFKGQPSLAGHRIDRWFADTNATMRARAKIMNTARKAGAASEVIGTGMARTGEALSNVPGKIGRFGGALMAEGVRTSEFGSRMKLDGLPLYNTGDASRTAMLVTSLAYSSVLAGSSRYFPMAVATGLATTGSRLGVFNTLRGIMAMGTKEGRALAKQAGIDKQWANIMEDALWTKLGHLSASMPSFNGVTVVGPSITATENMIRGWTFHAALGDMMRKGGLRSWDDVVEAGLANTFMHEAVRTTEEVNHIFGQLGKPPMMSRTSKAGSAWATQFLSFIPKQLEELMSQAMQNPGKIGQYMMISGYIQRVTAKTGIDVSDYVGSGFLPTSPEDATSITFEAVSSLIDLTNSLAKQYSGEGDAVASKRAFERWQNAQKLFIPLAMSAQRANKTADALKLGALYTEEGTKIRDYDLGQFEWDDSLSTRENLSKLPRGLLSESGDPGMPTELPSLLSGVASTQQRMERQAHRAGMTAARNQMYRRSELADALRKSVKDGSSADFQRQLRKMIDEGMLVPDIANMTERAYLEHALPRLMREQLSGEQDMLNYIDVLQRQRALYELQFNYSGGTE